MTYEEGSSSQAHDKQEITTEEPETRMSNSVPIKFSPIFMVPSRLRDVNPSSFTPRVVSIGPLHRGRENLKLMEDKKKTLQNELLGEVAKGFEKKALIQCKTNVKSSIEKIKGYYFGNNYLDCKYKDEELVEMMVMDACFILHFLYNLQKSGNPLSTNRLRSRSVSVDLVLLENQIPFFVLEDIYNLICKPFKPEPNLTTMLQDLLERVNPFFEKLKLQNFSRESSTPNYHILGLLHKFYQREQSSEIPEITEIPTAHTAVELHKVGVRFRTNQGMSWPLDVEFEKTSLTLRAPKVLIDNFFEVAMRNLIAYEQYSTPVRNYFTSYAMAMDMLAATPADIAKLAESEVIINHLGSNEKASNMISSICKDVTFNDFYYIESWKKANKYYIGYWSKYIGVLKRKYLSTPWKAVGLVVAIIVFAITIAAFVLRVITFVERH